MPRRNNPRINIVRKIGQSNCCSRSRIAAIRVIMPLTARRTRKECCNWSHPSNRRIFCRFHHRPLSFLRQLYLSHRIRTADLHTTEKFSVVFCHRILYEIGQSPAIIYRLIDMLPQHLSRSGIRKSRLGNYIIASNNYISCRLQEKAHSRNSIVRIKSMVEPSSCTFSGML